MECKQITLDEFKAWHEVQGVPYEHCAYKCVRCGHIQSAVSLVKYMEPEAALSGAYFLCEGRFAKELGCDWTLLFGHHKFEVLTESGHYDPVFEPATPEEAKALMVTTAGNIRKCRVCGCDDFHACPDGCYWAEPDLCSACKEKELSHAQT